MLIIDSDIDVTLLFFFSIILGLYGATRLQGFKTIWGTLIYVFLLKYIFIAIVLKIISVDPIQDRLDYPLLTATIVFLGFIGLLLAIYMFSEFINFKQYKDGLISQIKLHYKDYLILTIILIVFGTFGSLLRNLSSGVEPIYFKIFKLFIPISSISVYTIIQYYHIKNKKNFLFNYIVLLVVFFNISVGMISASKADLLSPLLVYGLTIVKFKGIKYKPLLIGFLGGIFIYIFIIYPYSQVVRYMGVKEGSLSQRIDVIEKINFNTLKVGISKFDSKYDKSSYLPIYFMPFNRFAMIGEAQHLISATYNKQSFTGFKTIIWGFQYALPSFFPWKRNVGTGNYLAHYSGQVGDNDFKTNISYGIFANAYNAFDVESVFIIVFLIYIFFFSYTYFFFGNPVTFSFYWFILFISLQHAIVEATIASFIATVIRLPLNIIVLLMMLKIITFILYRKKI